jgi:hypothetical protein
MQNSTNESPSDDGVGSTRSNTYAEPVVPSHLTCVDDHIITLAWRVLAYIMTFGEGIVITYRNRELIGHERFDGHLNALVTWPQLKTSRYLQNRLQ